DPDPVARAEDVRHLSKYVFPRQYGLASPFVSSERPVFQPQKAPDYLEREVEIQKKGPCKTPKRLKPILDLLDKVIWKHGKCRYKSLLDMACPSKVGLCCKGVHEPS
ncbi:hypothetical protein POSPLADRAFT_1155955, partial [Postia placenta MAD-698-R-SB12]